MTRLLAAFLSENRCCVAIISILELGHEIVHQVYIMARLVPSNTIVCSEI